MSAIRIIFNMVGAVMETPIKTRDGRNVRLTRWEVWDDSPVQGIVDGEDKERFWLADGRYLLGGETALDLFLGEDAP